MHTVPNLIIQQPDGWWLGCIDRNIDLAADLRQTRVLLLKGPYPTPASAGTAIENWAIERKSRVV